MLGPYLCYAPLVPLSHCPLESLVCLNKCQVNLTRLDTLCLTLGPGLSFTMSHLDMVVTCPMSCLDRPSARRPRTALLAQMPQLAAMCNCLVCAPIHCPMHAALQSHAPVHAVQHRSVPNNTAQCLKLLHNTPSCRPCPVDMPYIRPVTKLPHFKHSTPSSN